jgi:hypothetical protein
VELRIVVVHHVEQGGEAAVVEEAAFLMRPLSAVASKRLTMVPRFNDDFAKTPLKRLRPISTARVHGAHDAASE